MRALFACAVAAALMSSEASAAELLVENGSLVGANDITIAGYIAHFDVRFVEGSCEQVFAGCDDESDFLFETAGVAVNARASLQSQVFDGAYANSFVAMVPYDLWTASVPFAPGESLERVNFYGTGGWTGSVAVNSDTMGPGFTANRRWALFTMLPIPPVPEPGTWAMMLLGFGGMGVAMRRRRRAEPTAQLA